MSLSLTRTKAALEEWDRTRTERLHRFEIAENDEEVRLAEAALEKQWLEVSSAFFEESPNTMDRARLVNPDDPWLRELVKKYGGT